MEDKYAKAKHLFVKEKYNCAQAVACAFCQETGIPEEQLRALAASFGGGMGRLREVCGAVSGALLVLGALYGGYDPADTAAKARHYARVQEFAVSYTHLAPSAGLPCGAALRHGGRVHHRRAACEV